MKDPGNPLPAAEQEQLLSQMLAAGYLRFLDEHHGEALLTNKPLQQLKAKLESDQSPPDHSGLAEQEDFRLVYLQLLDRQRSMLQELNKKQDTDQDVIRKCLGLLDIEEEKLRIRFRTSKNYGIYTGEMGVSPATGLLLPGYTSYIQGLPYTRDRAINPG